MLPSKADIKANNQQRVPYDSQLQSRSRRHEATLLKQYRFVRAATEMKQHCVYLNESDAAHKTDI